jgi:hypothetical protein
MSSRLNDAISVHVSEWFHTVSEDDISPAQTIRDMNNNFIRFIRENRLKLAVHESTFRRFMCEAICTLYSSAKQRTEWQGPNSMLPRPNEWTHANEMAWRQYLIYMYFGSEFWTDFWKELGEPAIWEYDVPYWRYHMESFLPHYIYCDPKLISGGGSNSMIHYDSYSDYE